jgi:hypothetical protein
VTNDTFETSITWERFEKFHDAVKAATGNARHGRAGFAEGDLWNAGWAIAGITPA